jgi:hypothetical protein
MFGFFGPPSKKKFAAMLIKRIAAAGGPTDFVFDENTFVLKRKSQVAYLGNVHTAYCQATSKEIRTRLLDNFTSALLPQANQEPTFDEVRPHLVATVRERVLFSFSSLHWEIETDEAQVPPQVSEPISAWFVRTLALDYPGHLAFVNEKQIQDWGILTEDAFAVGLENLRNATTPKFSHTQGVFKGTWDDDYDSSRILLPGLFDDLPIKGEPVVVIPNRLTLLVAGSDDPDAIVRMLTQAEEILQSTAKNQNMAPLILKGGQIAEYSVSPSSPIFNAVERARKMAAMTYYEEQKKILESLYEKSGKDLFVASYTLMRHQGAQDEFRSHGVWSRDIATLLPVTDEVIFHDHTLPEGSQIAAKCSWKRVCAVLGDLMLDTKMFPTRFYVSKFTTPEQLRLLRK